MKLIQFTEASTGETVYVNADQVHWMRKWSDQEMVIDMGDSQHQRVAVQGALHEIAKRLTGG